MTSFLTGFIVGSLAIGFGVLTSWPTMWGVHSLGFDGVTQWETFVTIELWAITCAAAEFRHRVLYAA